MHGIEGFTYIPEYVSTESQDALVEQIEGGTWTTVGAAGHRIQEFGYAYSPRSGRLERSAPMPAWIEPVLTGFVRRRLFRWRPDQLVVSDLSGQGTSKQIDSFTCFGETIIGLSLCGTVQMDFIRAERRISVQLAERSLLILKKSARYYWKREIVLPHKRCFYLTFRIVTRRCK